MTDADKQLDIVLAAGRRSNAGGEPTGVRGRDSFIPKIMSPGPANYDVAATLVQQQAPRMVFGSSNRDKEQLRYISPMHSAAQPISDSPGPGTYRPFTHDRYVHHPLHSSAPNVKFGTAPQRTDEDMVVGSRAPGPIYSLPDEKMPQAYSFAPSSPEIGAHRSRSETSKLYISPIHSSLDRTGYPDASAGTGPGMYDLSNLTSLSPKRNPPSLRFGHAPRDAKDSLWQQQLAVEPLATTAAETPAPYTVLHPAMGKGGRTSPVSVKFGTGPRAYSPEKGSNAAGPYISRLHELSQLGAQSPGPGAYSTVATSPRNKAVGGWIGDAPAMVFGTGAQSSHTRQTLGPGPGAYNPSVVKAPSAPAHTLAPALRIDMATINRDPSVPGPGSYNVAEAAKQEATNKTSPSYHMGVVGAEGRSSFVSPTISPGPGAYLLPGAIDPGTGKVTPGYSFGLRERTVHQGSIVSVRFHGPLAAQEALGTQSPGPGLYNVRGTADILSTCGSRTTDVKFGSAPRENAKKVFISRQHAEAEGQGTLSPGPGAYDHASIELSKVTSRYAKAPNAAFGSSARFKANYMTF